MRSGQAILSAFPMVAALAACDSAAPLSTDSPGNSFVTGRAAPALEGAPDEPIARYDNARYGFTIAVPQGWTEFASATNEAGSLFQNRLWDADLRVFGSPNEGDVDFQQAIAALRDGTRDVHDQMIGEDEYRGAATDEKGYRIQLRLIRMPDHMVAAMMRYPVRSAADLDSIAAVTLGSLALESKR